MRFGDTIKAAGEAGILFVAAAGNDKSDNDRRPHSPGRTTICQTCSVLAALDRSAITSPRSSNYGAKTVHVAAPGAAIPLDLAK